MITMAVWFARTMLLMAAMLAVLLFVGDGNASMNWSGSAALVLWSGMYVSFTMFSEGRR